MWIAWEFPLSVYLNMQLRGHMSCVASMLNCIQNGCLNSHSHSLRYESSQFFSLPTPNIVRIVHFLLVWWFEVISQCCLNLYSQGSSVAIHAFMCYMLTIHFGFGICHLFIHILCPFFIGLFVFLLFTCRGSLYNLEYQSFVSWVHCQCFLQVCSSSFNLLYLSWNISFKINCNQMYQFFKWSMLFTPLLRNRSHT